MHKVMSQSKTCKLIRLRSTQKDIDGVISFHSKIRPFDKQALEKQVQFNVELFKSKKSGWSQPKYNTITKCVEFNFITNGWISIHCRELHQEELKLNSNISQRSQDKFESTQQNYNQGGLLNLKSYGGKRSGSQTVDYSSLYNQLGAQYNQEQAFQQQQINLNSDNSQSKLSRFKSNRGSSIQYQQNQAISANLDLDRMIQMKINSRNFKGDYVPARQRKSLSNSALTKGKNTYMFNGPALDIADLVQIKIRQPSREEFVDNLQQQNLGKMNYTDIKNMLVRNDNDRNNSGLQAQPFYTIQ
eukprot:403366307